MQKKYTSLGLMSGTSGDGVDASIIYSNGIDRFEVVKNKYFEYDSKLYDIFHSIKEKISNIKAVLSRILTCHFCSKLTCVASPGSFYLV